jgi:hypothetical protein
MYITYILNVIYNRTTYLHVWICVYIYFLLYIMYIHIRSRYSDSLRAARFGYRISVGASLCAPSTSVLRHTALKRMRTGVKRPKRGTDHPSPSCEGLGLCKNYTSGSPLCPHRQVSGWLLRQLIYIYAGIHTFARTYMRTCIPAHMNALVHTHIYICIHTYLQTCIHACIHTYSYVHTYTHTYIHT